MGPVDHPLARPLLSAFRWVDPGPEATHDVSDTSGWWRSAPLLAALGPALAGLFPDARPTLVVGPETSGFLLGPLVARELGAGFVEAYKDARGHVADRMLSGITTPDHRGRAVTLSLRARLLAGNDRVLLVDDWTDTGAQLAVLRSLVSAAGAGYVGAAVIVDGCPPAVAAELGVRSLLHSRDLRTASLDRAG